MGGIGSIKKNKNQNKWKGRIILEEDDQNNY
jgi:hypothetical protein